MLRLTDHVDSLFLRDPVAIDDPYPLYRRMRIEAPVYWHEPGGRWLLTRYDDVAAALRDPRLSADLTTGGRQEAQLRQLPEPTRSQARAVRRSMHSWMMFRDAPDHTRLRGLVMQAFTPRLIASLRGRIQAVVDALLDAIDGGAPVDIIHAFAYPLPAIVIAELLGVLPEDRDMLKRWSDEIGVFFDGRMDGAERASRAIGEMADYLRGVAAVRRKEPGDDLLSALVSAEQQGDRLTEEELYATCIFLLFAGHETTTNLIGNGLLALFRHPDQLSALRDDPTLITTAVEELLRYDSPAQYTARAVVEDLAIGGQHLHAGQGVMLIRAAANRDPARFADPDRLDIARRENRHLSFAHGPHYCLGAALARLEGQIAFATLLRRFPALRHTGDPLDWNGNIGLRGLNTLPVLLA
ncbi:MAG: cytochrome P450 [Chloroflexota bacterium]|nr:cytochrome P450 [Chloroflexota bacterium]